MKRLSLRYVGHRPGASLSYFSGHSVSLVPGELFQIPPAGLIIGRAAGAGLRLVWSQVARAHVRFWPIPEQLAVHDLGTAIQLAGRSGLGTVHLGNFTPEMGLRNIFNGRVNLGVELASIPIGFDKDGSQAFYRLLATIGVNC
jgi:hypothetical protein